MKNHGLKLGLCLAVALFAFGCSDDDSSDNKKPTGCTATVCAGDSLIVCNADGTTTTQACANGCDTATNQCKADSGNQGGNEGGNQGGNEGGEQGGNEGGNQGGNEGGNQGGNEGGNQGGNEGGNQGDSSVNENIKPVPSTQDNEEYADCDEDSFVEHCSGQTAVFCYYGMVLHDNCTEGNYKCLTMLEKNESGKEVNYAGCYEPCTKEGDRGSMCQPDYFEMADMRVDTVCVKTSVGLVYDVGSEPNYEYCSSPCENNTCKVSEACGDYTADGSCVGDALYWCYEDETTGQKELTAVSCDLLGATCGVDDDGVADCLLSLE